MKKESNSAELWSKEVESCEKREMTNDEALNFLRNSFAESRGLDDDVEKEIRDLLEEGQGGMASVVYRRAKYFLGYEISVSLAVFLGTILDNFGKSTIMASYLLYVAKKRGVRVVTMKEFGMFAFPMGLPTDKEWERLWTLQKLPIEERGDEIAMDNGLDCSVCFGTIKLDEEKSNEELC